RRAGAPREGARESGARRAGGTSGGSEGQVAGLAPGAGALVLRSRRRARRRTRLRHVLGAPLRAQPATAQLPTGVVRPRPGAARAPAGWRAENLVREAFMRRRIREVLADGAKPEQCLAVVGAFHAPVLGPELPAMTDEELATLRRRSSKLTLMPYSYFKLSSQSGYGAGNHAPAYFGLVWEMMNAGGLVELPHRYLSQVLLQIRG